MAMTQELDPTQTTGKLTAESKGIGYGEIIRDYDPDPGVTWRFGKPNYARVNKTFFKHRTKKHDEKSLEQVVTKIVKNWEVESHHIADINQWKTMDVKKFQANLNGGCPASAQLMADIGPYNLLLGDVKGWSSSNQTFETANALWSNSFTEGYAWECLEVYSGPPRVAFRWRHFGRFSGTFVDSEGLAHAGTGEILNLFGMTIATVNDSLVIEGLEVYYNPNDLVEGVMKGVASAPAPKANPGKVSMLAQVPVQKPAPDFSAKAVMGNGSFGVVNLSDFQGSYVVLFFYPLDFSFVCPTEILAFDDKHAEFKARGAEVIGISIDSEFAHKAYRNTPRSEGGIGPIKYPLVSDLKKTISKSYGVLCDDDVALRGLFIIDKAGIVRHALVNDLPLGRNVDEALRTLDALKHHDEHDDEVCPCNWQSGSKGMKATPEGVAAYLGEKYADGV